MTQCDLCLKRRLRALGVRLTGCPGAVGSCAGVPVEGEKWPDSDTPDSRFDWTPSGSGKTAGGGRMPASCSQHLLGHLSAQLCPQPGATNIHGTQRPLPRRTLCQASPGPSATLATFGHKLQQPRCMRGTPSGKAAGRGAQPCTNSVCEQRTFCNTTADSCLWRVARLRPWVSGFTGRCPDGGQRQAGALEPGDPQSGRQNGATGRRPRACPSSTGAKANRQAQIQDTAPTSRLTPAALSGG